VSDVSPESTLNNTEAKVSQEPIAIVGIGCRLPGGIESPDDLWETLIGGKDCVIDIPSDRWDPKKFHDPSGKSPGRTYANRGGILRHNIHEFDPGFFGISPREAEVMDPMQRILMEASWEAFEDAGINVKELAGSQTSVFVGGFISDNMLLHFGVFNRHKLGSHSAMSTTLTMLSNRMSYFYDFRGPSMSLDTACSSSLVAVHQACNSIWNGESKCSLVGGVNMLLTPETQITMSKGKFLSPNGRCNAFGAGADGYVRGEGTALVVLKPLSEALKDGNQIYSVIRGTAVNQDGKTNGITVPNSDAQIAAMKKSYAMAGIQPSQINYLEAHGTGTPVGDPLEAKALGTVLSMGRSADDACPIGSIKTNVGHMEAAAGVGGLLKASLVIKNRKLVPHLHLDELNPNIDLDALKLRIPTSVEDLPSEGELFAGVNSFGYGGTNAHVTVSTVPKNEIFKEQIANPNRPIVLPLSAAADEPLSNQANAMLGKITGNKGDVRRIATASGTQRSHLSNRAWIQGNTPEDIIAGLKSISEGQRRGANITCGAEENPKLMFVYTGMGPQWWAMGRTLFEKEPVYREAIEECDVIFFEIAGWSILEALNADEGESKVTVTNVAQPANFVVQYGLTKLLDSWGINADGIVGHSIGEVGAAWASGSLSLEQALTVAYHRSRLQHRTAGKGGMLAVGLSPDEALEWVEEFGVKVAVAAINGPSAVTLAGDQETLERIAEKLESLQRFNKFLQVEVPYHSPVMDEIELELKESLKHIKSSRMHTDLISSVTGERMQGGHDANYWWCNVRQSVLFSKAITTAVSEGYKLFVEIGPHPVLASSILESAKLSQQEVITISSLIRKQDEMDSLSTAVGKLYCNGVNLNWEDYFGKVAHIALPKYAWNKKVYWTETERSVRYRLPHDGHPMVSRSMTVPTLSWFVDLHASALPYIQDHQVAGSILFPGAGHVELGLGLACDQNGIDLSIPVKDRTQTGVTLEDIEFLAPALAPQEEMATLQAKPDTEQQSYKVFYQRADSQSVVCAQGRYFSGGSQPEPVDMIELGSRFDETWGKETLYDALAQRGLVYGPAFQSVESIAFRPDEVLANIELMEGIDSKGYLLHPILLDAALHSLIASDAHNEMQYDIVPMGIKRIQWFGITSHDMGDKLVSHGLVTQKNSYSISGDINLYTAQGEVCAIISGLKCRVMAKVIPAVRDRVKPWTFGKSWEAVLPGENLTSKTGRVRGKCFVIPSQNSQRLSASENESDKVVYLPQSWSMKNEPETLLDHLDEHSQILDLRFYDESESVDLLDQGINFADELLTTIQGLSERSLTRYVIVTKHSEAIVENDQVNLRVAPMSGLARTAMSERSNLNITLLDLDEQTHSVSEINEIVLNMGDNQEIAVRGEDRFALRLAPAELAEVEAVDHRVSASSVVAYEMHQVEASRMDSIEYREVSRPAVGDHEVEIEVDTCPLHFKDLMKAMGILSKEAEANTFFEGITGMEGSGVITAVGAKTNRLKVGDRVYSFGQFMKSHSISPESRAVKLPDNLSLTDSANIATYLTVYHSFKKVARLQKDETVLIHSATGGVGLAAINVAKWIGAEIIVTAGSEEKRDYLRALGLDKVSDSRSLSFVDDVQTWTSGRGVDVVLNFTPGETMTKSVHCLAPFGRFVELGKVSFDRNEALHLRPFHENLSYSAVDFDRICKNDPAYINEVVIAVLGLMSEGKIEPLPCKTFPAGQTVEAFQTMARAKHIGKISIKLKDETLMVQPAVKPGLFKADASYLITGGLGGFGLQVARWMSDNGAGHLALLSRSGASSDEAKQAISEMEASGTKISAYAADVSDAARMTEVFTDVKKSMPELKGVMHAAMVLDDKVIQEMDRASLAKVINAKAKGAWVLHQMTESMSLDFMVLYSSISSLVGNAGQANYVAANNFLDQLAHYRHGKGLPGLSINWGVFQETGVVARNEQLAKHLSNIGITPFSSEEATSALGLAVNHDQPQVGIMHVDWARFADLLPLGAGNSRFANLRMLEADNGTKKDNQLLKQTFADKSNEQRLDTITSELIQSVAAVMRMDAEDIKPTQSLRDLGLDSLMAVEIDVEFCARTGLDIPSMEMSSGPSIDELSKALLGLLEMKLPVSEDASVNEESGQTDDQSEVIESTELA